MEIDGYEFTELTLDEMIVGLKNRIREYEARKFQVMLDCKAEALSQNPASAESIRQLTAQDSDLTRALEMAKGELAALQAKAEIPQEEEGMA